MEIKNIIKVLKNKNGNGTMFVVVILIFMTIFVIGLEYSRVMVTVSDVRNALQESTTAIVTDNWDENFKAIRSGYSGGYTLENDKWIQSISKGDFYSSICSRLNLKKVENRFVYLDSNEEIKFYLSNIDVEVENAGLNINGFRVDTYAQLSIPIRLNNTVKYITIDVKSSSNFQAKF